MKIQAIIPELLVENIQISRDFYTHTLEFTEEIIFPEKDPVFVQIFSGSCRIKLYRRSDFETEIPKFKNQTMGGTFVLYIQIAGIQDFYSKIKGKVKVIQPLHKTDYGSTEFGIEDCNGYILLFSETSESA